MISPGYVRACIMFFVTLRWWSICKRFSLFASTDRMQSTVSAVLVSSLPDTYLSTIFSSTPIPAWSGLRCHLSIPFVDSVVFTECIALEWLWLILLVRSTAYKLFCLLNCAIQTGSLQIYRSSKRQFLSRNWMEVIAVWSVMHEYELIFIFSTHNTSLINNFVPPA